MNQKGQDKTCSFFILNHKSPTNSRQNRGHFRGQKGGLFMFQISINLTYQRNTINKTYQNIREKRLSLIKTNSDTEQRC